ncbi:hypothetical protein EDC04DRAFT_2605811 [Pisolithus marmoratus]|nr:hypothetical protein EDC04DRAFT_2605811 [Pisolithus marmoratus]
MEGGGAERCVFLSGIGIAALMQPPPYLHTVDGDLYIHHYGNKDVQIWLREGNQWVGDILDSHHHPMLPDYHLFVAKGIEPTWVTRKMRLTYKGRIHGHQKKRPVVELQWYQINYQWCAAKKVCRMDGHNACTMRNSKDIYKSPPTLPILQVI